jgi:hypothetical protein
MTVYSDGLGYKEVTLSSFIPVCWNSTVACFLYEGNEYSGTNFEGAGLSINVLRDRRSEKDCKTFDRISYPIKHTLINGARFDYGVTEGIATGHILDGTSYRAFHENVCFEVTLNFVVGSMGAYDPGTVKPFDGRKLDTEIKRMLHSFRFVGHVVDGPAWRVYHNSAVGGTFEYPDSDSVQKTVEYSNEKFNSAEITDSVCFADHGLYYTVAAKVNLRTEDRLREWLRTTGYPDLSDAQELRRFRYYTRYKAGPYYYVYGQTVLYMLSVSDAEHRVVSPDTAPVFRHFLESFKPE